MMNAKLKRTARFIPEHSRRVGLCPLHSNESGHEAGI